MSPRSPAPSRDGRRVGSQVLRPAQDAPATDPMAAASRRWPSTARAGGSAAPSAGASGASTWPTTSTPARHQEHRQRRPGRSASTSSSGSPARPRQVGGQQANPGRPTARPTTTASCNNDPRLRTYAVAPAAICRQRHARRRPERATGRIALAEFGGYAPRDALFGPTIKGGVITRIEQRVRVLTRARGRLSQPVARGAAPRESLAWTPLAATVPARTAAPQRNRATRSERAVDAL